MKILFLAESISLAHIARPLQLAKIAHRHGHEVHFACNEVNFKKAEKAELPFATYDLTVVSSSIFFKRVFQSRFPYVLEELQTYLHEDIDLINQIKPDLVVNDYRLTAYIAGRLTNTPVVQITNSYWHPSSDCPLLPAPSSSARFVGKGIFKILSTLVFRLYGVSYRRLLKSAGLPMVKDFREFYTGGDYTAYVDLPDFIGPMNLEPHQKVIGPILWQPDIPKSELGDYPKSGNIYVTLGGSGKESSLSVILKALESTGRFLILSGVSDQLKTELLVEFPFLKHRSIIKSLLNPEEFLSTCDLTICHGGSGTVYQSLNQQVPVFCFPSHSDQQLVSYYAREHGVCEFIYENKPSLKEIKKVLSKMLSSSDYKKNAILFSDRIKSCDTATNWCNLLSEIEKKTRGVSVSTRRTTRVLSSPKKSGLSVALQKIAEGDIRLEEGAKYRVRFATSNEAREEAYKLAYRVYRDKGYVNENEKEWFVAPYDQEEDTAVLVVTDVDEKVVGSVTLVFDRLSFLPVGNVFPDQINVLRAHGEKIVEISRLVIDPEHRKSSEVLLLLMNYASIYAYHACKYTCFAIEVNPRHQKFYENILDFTVLGDVKPSAFVKNAPAVLMTLSLKHFEDQIIKAHAEKGLSVKKSRSQVVCERFLSPENSLLVAEYLENQFFPITEDQKDYFGLYTQDPSSLV